MIPIRKVAAPVAMVLSRNQVGWIVGSGILFLVNARESVFSHEVRIGMGDWYGGIRFKTIGLAQVPPPIEGHRAGVSMTISSFPWRGVISGWGMPWRIDLTSYVDVLRDAEGKPQVDGWQDLRVFRMESFNAKGNWIAFDAEIAFEAALPLVVKAGLSLRHLDRLQERSQAEIFTVDWGQGAWYAEGKEEVFIPSYRLTRIFGTGGIGLRQALPWIPLTGTGEVVFYAPFQAAEDLWLSWRAEAILEVTGPWWFHLGYREDVNAHDPTRGRIGGWTVSVSYRL